MDIIVLTGHRKSGTSLFHKLFNDHPGVNSYPIDITLLYAFFPFYSDKLDSHSKSLRLKRVIKQSTESLDSRKINSTGQSFIQSEFIDLFLNTHNIDDLVSIPSICKAMALSWCQYFDLDTNKPFIFKETSQSVYVQNAIAENSDMKFVQIIRDPRDNYAAIKDGINKHYKRLGEGELECLASLINRVRVDLMSAQYLIKNNIKGFKAIQFENLVRDPERVMKSVSEFCEIPFHESLLRPTFLGSSYHGNSYSNESFSNISSKNLGKWKQRITEFEACVIEYWLADLMEYWNYKSEYSDENKMRNFSKFYTWYNNKYFFSDRWSD